MILLFLMCESCTQTTVFVMFVVFIDIFSPFAHCAEPRINHLHTRQLRFKDLPSGELARHLTCWQVRVTSYLIAVCLLVEGTCNYICYCCWN